MDSLIWIVPLLPLAGFLINGLGGKRIGERVSGFTASILVLCSFLIALAEFGQFLQTKEPVRATLFSWMSIGRFDIEISFLADSLSFVMILVVTGVSFLIHLYSIGYMKGDPGIQRYFAYLNLFVFMMLTLVMADNMVLLFLGWEGVGLCSYLLISFWFEDLEKAAAGKKAFIVNRIGDFGMLIGMFLLASRIGSLNFDAILASATIHSLSPEVVTAAALLLFLGAVGKSAQIPLYIWLPDAMAGPTPVSALIHAATMVTAGVYLIARCGVLFAASPVAMTVVIIIGMLTAFLAATMALAENDIKKTLAYSTISQLGYMFVAVGVGAFAAGIFHLMTHAFFKALLFLGAGSVIHAMNGVQDMRKMGGLRRIMPQTYWTTLVGVCAISGVPLLSGFFSKDEILWNAYSSASGGNLLYGAGVVTASLTAFYMFRLFYLTFHGQPSWRNGVKPHESPPIMTVPLVVLAVLSAFGGYVGLPESLGGSNPFHHLISHASPDATGIHRAAHIQVPLSENVIMIISTLAALIGIGLAIQAYLRDLSLSSRIVRRIPWLHTLISRKYYVDEAYTFLFVNPLRKGSDIIWKRFDLGVIDGIVNGSGRFTTWMGGQMRKLQTGVVQNYAAVFFIGVISVLLYLWVK